MADAQRFPELAQGLNDLVTAVQAFTRFVRVLLIQKPPYSAAGPAPTLRDIDLMSDSERAERFVRAFLQVRDCADYLLDDLPAPLITPTLEVANLVNDWFAQSAELWNFSYTADDDLNSADTTLVTVHPLGAANACEQWIVGENLIMRRCWTLLRAIGSASEDYLPNGPHPPDGFVFNGRSHARIQPLPWKILFELWPDKCLVESELADAVWGANNDPSEKAMSNAIAKANKVFELLACGKQVTRRNGFIAIT